MGAAGDAVDDGVGARGSERVVEGVGEVVDAALLAVGLGEELGVEGLLEVLGGQPWWWGWGWGIRERDVRLEGQSRKGGLT